MSNHSSNLDKEMFEKLFGSEDRNVSREQLKRAFLDKNIGATGKFPEGKMTENDEGSIGFAVGVSDNKVVIEFGTPVTWMGLPPETAEALGRLLIKRAKRCKR